MNQEMKTCVPDLHRHRFLMHYEVFGEEICTNCRFVFCTKLLVYILIHDRAFPHSSNERLTIRAYRRRMNRKYPESPRRITFRSTLSKFPVPGEGGAALLRYSSLY